MSKAIDNFIFLIHLICDCKEEKMLSKAEFLKSIYIREADMNDGWL